jgi:hypothetical protein
LLAGDAHAPHLERLEVNQHFGHADCLGLSWIVLGCVGVCWGVLGCLGVSWSFLGSVRPRAASTWRPWYAP